MQFAQVIGQEALKGQLVNMVQQNRLSHALLFLAKEGSGGLSLARAFAQYAVCEKVNGHHDASTATASLFGEPSPPGSAHFDLNDSCGDCLACKKAAAMVHPDIHFSFPVIPKKSGDKPTSADYIKEWREFIPKNPYANSYDWLQFLGAENKQGNITSDECEDIWRQMNLKSFEARYKILIMWMPELLGKEGNKLLKLIEEPPPHSLFLLVAENESLILPTILSRTQLVKFPVLSDEEVAAALQARENIAVAKSREVAAMSHGNYHEALKQLEQADDDWELLLRDWLNSIVKTGPAAQVKWIDEVSKTGRENQKQFIKYFIHLLEHAIRLRVLGRSLNPASENQSATDFAGRFNKLCDISQQEAMIRELDLASYYIERNANAKMLFHALTIKLYHIISNKSVILMQ